MARDEALTAPVSSFMEGMRPLIRLQWKGKQTHCIRVWSVIADVSDC